MIDTRSVRVSTESWLARGEELGARLRDNFFALGDWWNEIPAQRGGGPERGKQYDTLKKEGARRVGLEARHLGNLGVIAKSVPPENRVAGIPHTVWQKIATLAAPDQPEVIKLALESDSKFRAVSFYIDQHFEPGRQGSKSPEEKASGADKRKRRETPIEPTAIISPEEPRPDDPRPETPKTFGKRTWLMAGKSFAGMVIDGISTEGLTAKEKSDIIKALRMAINYLEEAK